MGVKMTNVILSFSVSRLLGILAMIGATTSGFAQTLSIVPSNPIILQPVVARLVADSSCLVDRKTLRLVSQIGSTIRIEVQRPGCLGVPPGSGPITYDISLGQFPPGDFNVELFVTFPTFPPLQLGSAHFSVTDTNPTKTGPFPVVNYTDHWWSPPESGWALTIVQHPSDLLFAVWFVYGPSAQPIWYTLQPGTWLSSIAYTGPIYKTTGPYYGGPFNPAQVGITQVGTGTVNFANSNSGTFAYTVEGVTASKPITRLPF